jgi:hypothetical protein
MMDCEDYGGITITGNFAELQQTKPEPFNYDKTAKWIEPYACEWREVLGDAVCSCTTVEVHYAPYYGFDHYHRDTCNLMRKLRAEPQIQNLREVSLPAMIQYSDSVPNTGKISIWVENKTKRSKKVSVRHKVSSNNPLQVALI